MRRQEWFENRVKKLRFQEDCHVPHLRTILEDWKMQRMTFLKMVIGSLPRLERQIIYLSFYRNFSERKIAKKLDIARPMVQRRKKRAIGLLLKAILRSTASPLSSSFRQKYRRKRILYKSLYN